CPGSCDNITVTVTGTGPFSIHLTGAGVNVTSNLTAAGSVTFPNIACAPTSGLTNTYVASVADFAACTTSCSTTLAGTPIPTCTLTPPASLCPGSTHDITVTGAGGTGALTIAITKNGVVVAGP